MSAPVVSSTRFLLPSFSIAAVVSYNSLMSLPDTPRTTPASVATLLIASQLEAFAPLRTGLPSLHTSRAAFAISGSVQPRISVLPRPLAFSTSAVNFAASAFSSQFTYTSSTCILSPIRSQSTCGISASFASTSSSLMHVQSDTAYLVLLTNVFSCLKRTVSPPSVNSPSPVPILIVFIGGAVASERDANASSDI